MNIFSPGSRRRLRKDPLARIIVLVPPQATLSTENHIMRALHLKGLMGVWVMGPERLKQRILDAVYGRARPVIDASGKSMILRQLMGRYKDALFILGARVPGLCPDIAALFSELKSMDISPGQIAALDPGDTATAKKFKDLSFLYEKFEEVLKDRALTGEDRMNIAIQHVGECRFIAESDVYVFDFGLYTAQMGRLVGEMARVARNTAVAFLDTNPSDPDADLFDIARRERAMLQKEAPGARVVFLSEDAGREGEAAHIAKNLYAYPYARHTKTGGDIQIIRALTPEQEVEAAAENIARLVAEEGFSMGEIAVAAGSVGDFEKIIKEKFTQSNIPFFSGR